MGRRDGWCALLTIPPACANISQIALCTADLPGTVRTLMDVLGFASAGGRPRWGEDAARIQELPSGNDTSIMMWWLIGRQDFVQIELFHHTVPAQRPRRPDWKPSDLGWVRFGVHVADFDATMRRLHTAQIVPLSAPVVVANSRRVCFREPGSDAIIEILEEDVATSCEVSPDRASGPALAYVAASVSDLESARRYFGQAFGFPELTPDEIHQPGHESMWGLDGARRQCAVFRARDVLIEVMQYDDPVPSPPPKDALLSDQGIMNAALGFRDRALIADAVDAASSLGATASNEVPDVSGGVYLRIVDRLSVEMLLVPPALDVLYGFRSEELAPPGIAFPREIIDKLVEQPE